MSPLNDTPRFFTFALMAKDQLARYIWIVDTLKRHGRLTRQRLNELWLRSSISDGKPMPERTFYYYRRAIEENFHILIECNKSAEYYIVEEGDEGNKTLSDWLLDSVAISNAMKEYSIDPARIEVEDVPSARRFLPIVLEAVSLNQKINFTYAGFNRSREENNIIFSPYFLKRYKQRWYMLGLREKSGELRTYALDRIREMRILPDKFEMPEDLKSSDVFGNIIGVTSSKADTRTVRLKATSSQAKYLRALPLHPSQQEEIHDDYSIFTYNLKLNYDLVSEILSLGEQVKVLEPRELRLMVIMRLREALALYE